MLKRRTSPSRAHRGALSVLSRVTLAVRAVWRSGSVARLLPLVGIAVMLGAGQACSSSSSGDHGGNTAGTSEGDETGGRRQSHSHGGAAGSRDNAGGAAIATRAGAQARSTGGDNSAGGDSPASVAGAAGAPDARTGGRAGAPAAPAENGGADRSGGGPSGTGAAGATQTPSGRDAGTGIVADAGAESGTSGAAGFPSAPDPSRAGAGGQEAGTGGEQTAAGGAEVEPDAGVPLCTPSAERCDGIDNDCDGVVDDGNPGGGVACSTGLLGACAAGTTVCVDGSVRCTANTAASPERCDGLDNDCDGEVDENDADDACDTGLLGVCAKGELLCTDGVLTCAATTLPGTIDETCNGKDDDCDGTVDEGNPPGGDACSTDLPGVCSDGVTDCSSGSFGCVPTTAASAERCNGLDDDCDGEVDGDVCANDLESGASGWALGSLWSLRTGGHSGTQSLRGFWTNMTVGCNVSSDAVLLTDIDLTSATSATLEFATMATVGTKDFLELYVSTDGGLMWSFLSSVGATSYWATLRYNLDQFVGAPHVRVNFSFYNGCGDSYGVDWSIDDVRILITTAEE